jgi:hypothetical protein
MRRFQITSEKYNGMAELLFNDKAILCRIDCTQTDMDAATITAFKKACPASIEQLQAGGCFAAGTVVVEADFEITFEMFWTKYNHKINRKRCELLWARLSKVNQVKAYYGIDEYDKFLKRTGWRKKADPEKYLNENYWENEWRNAE